MKKRFKKVVEWEEKPDFYFMLFGIILLLGGLASSFIGIYIKGITTQDGVEMISFSVGLLISGILVILSSLGKGRKVLLEEVK